MAKKAEVIPPDAYPQMVSKAQAKLMANALRSHVTAVKASRVIEDSGEILRDAVRAYVEELEGAGMNFDLVSDKAHEIRGFAETAGMLSTGRIADGLCRYFDDAEQSGVAPDHAVVALHVSAIGRTARDPDSVSQMNDVVARELSLLSERLSAERALEWGLVNRVFDDADVTAEAMTLAEKLAAGPAALGITRQLYRERDAHEAQLAREAAAQEAAAKTEDFREGIGAFFAKRPPRFTGR